MRYLLLLIALVLFTTFLQAQSYLITFTGTGASTTIDSVKVENLTSGTTLKLIGSNILRLTGTTGINSIENKQASQLNIYPNPMTYNTTVEFSSPISGDALITIHNIAGKLVAQNQSYLDIGQQSFRLSGLNCGFYLVSVKGISYQYSGKLLCNGNSEVLVTISHISNSNPAKEKSEQVAKADSKGVQATVDMAYNIGDRLKLTGISGIYSTIKTDIPTRDKTISFNFIACTDANNNNYSIVEIGTQVWMAENLNTTKYYDNTTISYVTDNKTWSNLSEGAFCWTDYISDPSDAIYGAFYNWYAVNTGKLCPQGWHVPNNTEWITLTNYLGGYLIAGAKLKETGIATWGYPNANATNETGFTALSGGFRKDDGSFYDNIYHFYYGGAHLWSSTSADIYNNNANAWSLEYEVDEIYNDFLHTTYGLSVRCIK